MIAEININDILNLENLDNVKIRFVLPYKNQNPIELFKHNRNELLNWQFWNYSKKRSFREGEIAIGFVKIDIDKWLLFDISYVTKDLNIFNGVGYEYESINKYEKFLGRTVIKFKNNSQNLVRKATSVISECIVSELLETTFNDDIFPGYDNVNISWKRLEKVINNNSWKSALQNQKGIYLVTDKRNGKMYVGSAYGENMIHGRWSNYISNGNGGNKELKNISFEDIKENFNYSILEIYKSTVEDRVIINRESWWKETLMTRLYGYNSN